MKSSTSGREKGSLEAGICPGGFSTLVKETDRHWGFLLSSEHASPLGRSCGWSRPAGCRRVGVPHKVDARKRQRGRSDMTSQRPRCISPSPIKGPGATPWRGGFGRGDAPPDSYFPTTRKAGTPGRTFPRPCGFRRAASRCPGRRWPRRSRTRCAASRLPACRAWSAPPCRCARRK